MLDARGAAVPTIVHWGADLGETSPDELVQLCDAQVPAVVHAAADEPIRATIFPSLESGQQGRPALRGTRSRARSLEPFGLVGVTTESPRSLRCDLRGRALAVTIRYELTEEGLLCAGTTVTNLGADEYRLDEVNLQLPIPARAREILDFSGRWSSERRPQRRPLLHESIVREMRHGRPGHDSPYVMVAGTPSFGFGVGETWAIHFGWSGNQRLWAERQPSLPAVLGAGELLEEAEVTLRQGESYLTPILYGSWSDAGLDGVSSRFHNYLRRTRGFSSRAHPIILNTWEAIYFDHDDAKLGRLAEVAASVGVERFVLDDGWMSGRRDDRHGLGDWTVDVARRPEGLTPLIERVTALGMDFGLWVEPEMLNLDSDTARAHPDWLLAQDKGTPLSARAQYVVNLAIPEAFAQVLGQLSDLLSGHKIAYLKWDHNRDLFTPFAHDQTRAVYRLMDELSARHPEVEIESCASGGGRIDFGILQRTARVWPSDTNDSLERQAIYRWSTLLIPPELFGAHVGAATAHTTGRTHSLSFRLATALFGWAGIEWDLTKATSDELVSITAWAESYKELRPLLHAGRVVRADRDDALWLHGIISVDQSQAVYSIAAIALGDDAIPDAVRFPSLDPARRYHLQLLDFGAEVKYLAVRRPSWMTERGDVVLTGRVLSEVGIAAPPLAPEQAIVLKLTAI